MHTGKSSNMIYGISNFMPLSFNVIYFKPKSAVTLAIRRYFGRLVMTIFRFMRKYDGLWFCCGELRARKTVYRRWFKMFWTCSKTTSVLTAKVSYGGVWREYEIRWKYVRRCMGRRGTKIVSHTDTVIMGCTAHSETQG